jgi:hypothetical protein
MKTIIRSAALVFVLLASAAAQATTFNYSYTFATGEVVTGAFDGTANGNLVTGLSNISVLVNGSALPSSGSMGAYFFEQSTGDWISNPVVSFDGLESNFTFASGDPYDPHNAFLLVPYGTVYTDLAQLYYQGFEPSELVSNARWHLEAVTAVPEAETYAMLLGGLGLLGAIARRRKQS